MKRVVERCPNCGVEHDEAVGGECEVCGTPLRFWCRVHGKEIGFLNSAECPRCVAEEQARRSRPVPPRAPAPSRGEAPTAPVEMVPRRPRRPPVGFDAPPPPYAGRDPREVAEDMRPYVEAGANFAVLMVRALFAVLRHVIGWGVLGGIAGGVIGFQQGGDPIWSAMFGVMVGGGAGLFFGAISALRILFGARRREH